LNLFTSIISSCVALCLRCSSLTFTFSQGSLPDDETETKKPRRTERLEGDADKTPVVNKQHLPSPLTHHTDDYSEVNKDSAVTSPEKKENESTPKKSEDNSQSQALSSPPQDTQPLSQFADRHPAISDDIEDEIREGVWGYLVPLDPKYGDKPIVLKKRSACPLPHTVSDVAKKENENNTNDKNGKSAAMKDEETFEKKKEKGAPSGGYLIGRHPECGK
jgi:serine/threonine-protein kinase Chk2